MEKKEIDFKEKATVKELKEINKDLSFDVILITNKSQVIYYNDDDVIIVNSKFKDNQEGQVVFIPKDTQKEKEMITGSPLIYSITSNFSVEEWMQSNNYDFNIGDNNNVITKKCEKNADYKELLKEKDEHDIKSVGSNIGDKSINFYIEIPSSKYECVNSKTNINYTAKSEVINIIKEKKELDLYDCLNLFKENPKSSITCEKCKEKPKMTTYICKNPYYLLIHLKRFYLSGGCFRKNNVPVEFKEELNIYDYISDEYRKNLPKAFFDYELFAVNIHSGGVGGGHYYYAYCKVDNEWYCFNDSSVNKSSYLGEQAYVLLYKQKNPFVTETHTMK